MTDFEKMAFLVFYAAHLRARENVMNLGDAATAAVRLALHDMSTLRSGLVGARQRNRRLADVHETIGLRADLDTDEDRYVAHLLAELSKRPEPTSDGSDPS